MWAFWPHWIRMTSVWRVVRGWLLPYRRGLAVARSALRRSWRQRPHTEEPLRAQLFSGEQMALHGAALARSHRVRIGRSPEALLARLKENEEVLRDARAMLVAMLRDDVRITPAGEWLLDNFHLVEDQILTARRHLPTGYSRQLPALSNGPSIGLPRVYALSMDAIAHGDGRIDADVMGRFVVAYQTVTPLKLGELWAIPIMLRLGLLENLRRVATRVVRDGVDHRLASDWAGRLNTTAVEDPKSVVLVVADMARSQPPLSGAFVAELVRGLHGRGGVLAMPVTWVEQWLADGGQRVEELVHLESHQQAADQVSISNSIASLRFLSTMDWRDFVEDLSVVESHLRQDPDGTYAQMDFQTRDSYRHSVEMLARRSGASESDVAACVVRLAGAGAGDDRRHVGYYLVDDGLHQMAEAVAGLPGAHRAPRVAPRTSSLVAYMAPITAIAMIGTWMLMRQLQMQQVDTPLWLWAVIALAGLVVFSELGIALVNWVATLLVPPRALPRMDFSKGVPSASRTLVAVPSMLTDIAAVDELVEGLEVRFLANRDANMHFALLTDFLDADQATLPTDAALLDHAAAQIARLNRRYAPENGDRFFLFHRPRTWNTGERTWMGHERKRGKLAALNRVLRGGNPSTDFSRVIGTIAALEHVRYVITLDTDTRLPRDAAREFVATLAHPLNRARIDPEKGRVTRGYGILQPSVGSMSAHRISRYARLFGSEPGIDPYTRTVSDVYQDLFGEGSFVGKGIYEVDAFEQVLAGRLPDNRILSHDLLEGCYARAGLVSDVRLFEDYPSRYAADVKRRGRWIRGDWQLLPWLLPWVPRAGGGNQSNPLSMLSRAKLLDNLRRSLVPLAATALLLLGWWSLPSALVWTSCLLGLFFLPVLVPALHNAVSKPPDLAWHTHIDLVGRALWSQLLRAVVTLACLPYEAGYSAVAILRTLWRVVLSRRRLLQWDASSEVERSLARGGAAELRSMAPASLFAMGVLIWLAWRHPLALWVAGPLLALWSLSPLLMTWMSRAGTSQHSQLSAPQQAFLGRLARRTWAFFEVHMRAEDHWLPPDNVQEHPQLVVARRTSPTNIGLALLGNLAAYDLGYLQAGGVIERTRLTLATMETLPRHRGHFYNWYDTATLEPLPPKYLSTVDSGNLAGHLLTLRQGLLALCDAPVLAVATYDGLADTLGVLRQERLRATGMAAALDQALDAFALAIEALREQPPSRLSHAWRALNELAAQAAAIAALWPPQEPVASEQSVDILLPHWPLSLLQACQSALDDMRSLTPWLITDDPAAQTDNGDIPVPTLRELAALIAQPDAAAQARARIHQFEHLAHVAGQLSLMEYGFLYDPARRLLAIGYNVDERRLDQGYYDLLASEARLCSFVAIAQGQLPQESWFALGRLLTEVDGQSTLLSWSGSMFEYLMPQLVMPSYADTLIEQTSQHAVQAQIAHGARHGVPWGVSESGYNAVDARMNYQYRAFGVPGLGAQARSRPGPGDRALREHDGSDGGPGGRVPKPPAADRGRLRRPLRAA
jgi:cyclic beta-1,2-glucan synthetase